MAPWDPDDPMSIDELTAKFIRLAEPLHGDAATSLAARLIDKRLQANLATVLVPASTA